MLLKWLKEDVSVNDIVPSNGAISTPSSSSASVDNVEQQTMQRKTSLEQSDGLTNADAGNNDSEFMISLNETYRKLLSF